VYRLVVRARKYVVVGGMEKVRLIPQPLTVGDISEMLEAHPSPLCRDELDPCLFALDDEDRSAWEGER